MAETTTEDRLARLERAVKLLANHVGGVGWNKELMTLLDEIEEHAAPGRRHAVAETGCAHFWQPKIEGRRYVWECRSCGSIWRTDRRPAPVPAYRDAWAAPPSTAFRRTDGAAT